MSLVVTYESGLSSEFIDISDRFRQYTFDVAQDAEEGSVATSSVTIDDPDGDLNIKGWRRFRFYENAASGSNTLIANLWITDRTVSRGPYKTGAGRQWVCSVADMNSVLAFRVFTQGDANRPAETDVQRIAWMQGELGTPGVPETEYVDTSNPVNMDAVDYRGQTRLSVIDDCAQASGKNYFVYTKDTTPLTLGLWYAQAGSTLYSSPLRLTNVLSDISGDAMGMTYAIAEDSELKRDPSRVNSGAYGQYDGGNVYEELLSISNEFTRRDAIVPMENVKTAAKATARALRYLTDFDTEDDRVSTAVILPADKVNFVREGMRIQYKAIHQPGYEVFNWMRVLQRKVKFNSEQPDAAYLVSLELSQNDPPQQIIPGLSLVGTLAVCNDIFNGQRNATIQGLVAEPGHTYLAVFANTVHDTQAYTLRASLYSTIPALTIRIDYKASDHGGYSGQGGSGTGPFAAWAGHSEGFSIPSGGPSGAFRFDVAADYASVGGPASANECWSVTIYQTS